MKKIGILGDIGSGKTYISKLFNLPVFNADDEVKKIYKSNKACFYKLKKRFPKFITRFPIDKKQLINLVSSKKNITKVGKIVHPFVTKKLKIFLKKNQKKSIILDIPLLLENKILDKKLILIFVDAKSNLIRKKLQKRIGFNEKIYKIMKQNQLSLSKKKKKSNYIIKNNFKKNGILKQIKKIKLDLKKYDRNSS